MAKFTFDEVDYISAQFDQAALLTDEDKLSVIMPAAELLKERHSAKIRQLFRQPTGTLADSISIIVKTDDDGSYAHITPKGKHPKENKGERKRKKTGTKRKYSGTNAEVAFVLEYGSVRIRARHWMESANEEAESEIAETQQQAFNEMLEKKGLI